MDCKELIEWLRHTVKHGDEDPLEYCTNRCGGCEMCDRAAEAIETLLAELDAAQKEAKDLQIQWDMYGGDEGVTAAFQKAEERDAAVEDLRGICWGCSHATPWIDAFGDRRLTACEYIQEQGALARGGDKCECPHWQWRGLQKGENNDQAKL